MSTVNFFDISYQSKPCNQQCFISPSPLFCAILFSKMSKNLKAQKSAILLNQGKVRAMQWRRYLENNWDKLTKNLNNATILFLTGRHGLEDGKIGAADETILTNQAEQVGF